MNFQSFYSRIFNSFGTSLVAAVVATALVLGAYFAFEPVVSRSQSSQTFEVSQTILDEISLVIQGDVTMNGSISGLTGGYATGSMYAVVTTNDEDGYSMTIRFPYATTSGMQANASTSVINNYSLNATSAPDYAWVDNATGQAAEFGYTINASTSVDVAQRFRDNGTICDTGTNSTGINNCWMHASTAAITIINRTSGSAPNGATSTLKFKVAVPNSPSPTLAADTYVATATLTATNN